MRFRLILAVSLAVLAMPVVAHAEMPGTPCPLAEVGSSKLADDQKNIIACLKTSDTTAEWKSMTSGGGGITGGCTVNIPGAGSNSAVYMGGIWGRGCKGHDDMSMKVITEDGYECGASGHDYPDMGSRVVDYICIKK